MSYLKMGTTALRPVALDTRRVGAVNRGTVHGYRHSMGGIAEFFEDINQTVFKIKSESEECLDAANAQTAPLDAKTNDLARSWNPTGFYTPAQVDQLVSATMMLLNQAKTTIASALGEYHLADNINVLRSFGSRIDRKMGESAIYTSGANAARAADGVVNAPGIKDWILKSMVDVSTSFNAVSVVSCMKPWWFAALGVLKSVWDRLVAIAKAIVGVLVKVGQTIVKVADDLGTIWTVVKWGGLAAIGVFAVLKLKKYRDSR